MVSKYSTTELNVWPVFCFYLFSLPPSPFYLSFHKCMSVCMHVCMLTSMCVHLEVQRSRSCVLLHCISPYSLETGLLTKPKLVIFHLASWAAAS